MRSRTIRLIAVAAAAALGLGAASVGALGARTNLSLRTPVPCCLFNKKTLSAKAGTVRITLLNTVAVSHNVAIKKGSRVLGKGRVVRGPGKRSTVTASLRRGTCTYFCSVPGHEAAGMKGILRVQ